MFAARGFEYVLNGTILPDDKGEFVKLPRGLARFNKRVNPIQRRWAPTSHPGPWSNTSAANPERYSIPVLAWVDGDKVSIVLGYGRKQRLGTQRRGRRRFRDDPTRAAPTRRQSTRGRLRFPDIAAGARSAARRVEHVLTGTIAGETA